ncbi:MAG: hypothetical protein WCF45_04005 [Photobacterium halotolerans]
MTVGETALISSEKEGSAHVSSAKVTKKRAEVIRQKFVSKNDGETTNKQLIVNNKKQQKRTRSHIF